MNNKNITDLINEYKTEVNAKYPHYTNQTEQCFDIINDIIIFDYTVFSSDNKRTRYINKLLTQLVTFAFSNVGVKNYLLMIIRAFDKRGIKEYITSNISVHKELYQTVERIENRITYWQGFERNPERHLEHIIDTIDNPLSRK